MRTAVVAAILGLSTFAVADTIQNGGFEQGLNPGNGWIVSKVDNGAFNNYYVQGNAGASVLNGLPVAPVATGAQYALSDSIGSGVRAISQTFTAPSTSKIILSFDMFVNHWADYANDGNGFGSSAPVDQSNLQQVLWQGAVDPGFVNNYATVDILAAGSDPLSDAVLHNIFLGVTGTNFQVNGWTHYTFDLTGILTPGQQYEIRFADVAGLYYLQTGVDNVSIGSAAVPEPTSLVLLGSGLFAGGVFLRRRSAS